MHRFTCHCCISMCMARESLHESSSRPKCSHVRSICKAGVFEHKVHIEYLCVCEAGIHVFKHKVHKYNVRLKSSSRLKYSFVRYVEYLNVSI